MNWEMSVARRKFSQVVQRAIDEGPQVVTRHGESVVVVISAEEYRRLTCPKPDFAEFLLSAPDPSLLDLERTPDLTREIEL